MEFMILINVDETQPAPTPGTPEFEQMMGAFFAYNQQLIDGGHWVSAANLVPTAAATTIRRSFAQGDVLIDGPFAEAKEHLAGYYLISAKDLDEALALAKALPIPAGSLEVRPVAFRPDAA